MRNRTFTLIELLVVIAIIGVLASILLPSLQKARDKVKTAVCMSNEKQVGIALISHSSTEDGRLPRSGGQWGDKMGTEAYLSTPTGTMQEQTSGNVLYCPTGLSDEVSAHASNGGWNYINLEESRRPWESNNGKFSWYGVVGSSNPLTSNGWRYNTWKVTNSGTTWPKISLLVNLEGAIAIHDGSKSLNTFGGTGGRIAARHDGFKKTNALFYDGHVKTYGYSGILSTKSNDGDSDGEIIWRGSRSN